MVQGFFVHLFERNTLSHAEQEKGRLRTFLLVSLQNFLLTERTRMRAIKRGGSQQIVSFDLNLPEAEAAMQATAHLGDVNFVRCCMGIGYRSPSVAECAGKVCRRGQT